MGATTLRFGESSFVQFDSPAEDGSDAEAAESHSEDDADGDHGVCALRLTAVDVSGQQGEVVGGAGADVECCCVGVVHAGARTTVAHDPGSDAGVETVHC